jgi:hypothetical protein
MCLFPTLHAFLLQMSLFCYFQRFILLGNTRTYAFFILYKILGRRTSFRKGFMGRNLRPLLLFVAEQNGPKYAVLELWKDSGGPHSYGLTHTPSALINKSFRTATQSPKHNFEFFFSIKIFIEKLYMYIFRMIFKINLSI